MRAAKRLEDWLPPQNLWVNSGMEMRVGPGGTSCHLVLRSKVSRLELWKCPCRFGRPVGLTELGRPPSANRHRDRGLLRGTTETREGGGGAGGGGLGPLIPPPLPRQSNLIPPQILPRLPTWMGIRGRSTTSSSSTASAPMRQAEAFSRRGELCCTSSGRRRSGMGIARRGIL